MSRSLSKRTGPGGRPCPRSGTLIERRRYAGDARRDRLLLAVSMPHLDRRADANPGHIGLGDVRLNSDRLDLGYFENRLSGVHENAGTDEALRDHAVGLGA